MKLKIKVTKEILERSKMCNRDVLIGQNCAIALAIREVFPKAYVAGMYIFEDVEREGWDIDLPLEARSFIKAFDLASAQERIKMPEIEFTIDLNEDVLASINIDEAKEAIKHSKTLELVQPPLI